MTFYGIGTINNVSNPSEIVLTQSCIRNPQYIIVEIVDILNSYLKIENDFSKYLRGVVSTIMINISLTKKSRVRQLLAADYSLAKIILFHPTSCIV